MRDWPIGEISPQRRRAVFLDRDGTLNRDTHFPYRPQELEFEQNALEGLKALTTLPLDIIVVANQAGIALGYFTREQMSDFNATLLSRIVAAGARIDAIYYCPHLEPKHLKPGQTPCDCSKPSPGMLIEAAKEFEVDCTKSFLVGDKSSDIAAGAAVGCITILVKTGKAGREEAALNVKPSHIARDLNEAVTIISSYIHSE